MHLLSPGAVASRGVSLIVLALPIKHGMPYPARPVPLSVSVWRPVLASVVAAMALLCLCRLRDSRRF